MQQLPLILGLVAGVLAALYATALISRINKLPAGNERMQEISGAIQEGAMAYLKRQYKTIAIVAIVIAVILVIPGLFGVAGFGVWTAVAIIVDVFALWAIFRPAPKAGLSRKGGGM